MMAFNDTAIFLAVQIPSSTPPRPRRRARQVRKLPPYPHRSSTLPEMLESMCLGRTETAETRTTFLKPLPDEVRHALPLGLSPFLPLFVVRLAGAEGASGRIPVPIASPQHGNQQSCIIRFMFYFCVFFFITLCQQR